MKLNNYIKNTLLNQQGVLMGLTLVNQGELSDCVIALSV